MTCNVQNLLSDNGESAMYYVDPSVADSSVLAHDPIKGPTRILLPSQPTNRRGTKLSVGLLLLRPHTAPPC
eukprot:1819016-Rhodomonas_salina.1